MSKCCNQSDARKKIAKLFDLDADGRAENLDWKQFNGPKVEERAPAWAVFALGLSLPVLWTVAYPGFAQFYDGTLNVGSTKTSSLSTAAAQIQPAATAAVASQPTPLFKVSLSSVPNPVMRPIPAPHPILRPMPVTDSAAANIFEKVKGMSAKKSTITGIVDSRTMTASYYWTMKLTNHNASQLEAKMKFSLPEGAVVSRATLWINDKAEEAAFNSTWSVQDAYNWIVSYHRDPLLITQEPDGKILVKMSPVPSDGQEVKLRLGITCPLKSSSAQQAEFDAPVLNDSNFSFDCKQDVHLESSTPLYVNNSEFKSRQEKNGYLLAANINSKKLAELRFQTARPDTLSRFATRATHTLPGSYIIASIEGKRNSQEQTLHLEKHIGTPDCPIIPSEDAAFRVSTLWAKQEIDRIFESDPDAAVQLGKAYRVVSRVTGAVVLETESDYQMKGLSRNQYETISYADKAKRQIQAPAAAGAGGSSEPTAYDAAEEPGGEASALSRGSQLRDLGTESSDFVNLPSAPAQMSMPAAPKAQPMPSVPARLRAPSEAKDMTGFLSSASMKKQLNYLNRVDTSIAGRKLALAKPTSSNKSAGNLPSDSSSFEDSCASSNLAKGSNLEQSFTNGILLALTAALGPIVLLLNGLKRLLQKKAAKKALLLSFLWTGTAICSPLLSVILLAGLAAARIVSVLTKADKHGKAAQKV
ncbi:MAG: hypothetical protein K2X27_07210 [Candidatus Obscuribacterales bacterium]|nr:hypothetical protein [Candidatus Obscuribacterales bacterium]